MNPQPLAADLFSGAGGLSLGFKAAGYRLAFALDVNWDAMRTYTANNPGVPWLCKDVRKVLVKEIEDVSGVKRGDVDIVIAGIPCEGYSQLNRRYDPSDPRNYLFLEFLRIVKALRPKAVLIENVPGMSRRSGGLFRRAVEDALRKIGYTVYTMELNALNYGVPQKRERVFFAGFLGSIRGFSPPHPTHNLPSKNLLSYMDRGNAAESGFRRRLTVWDAISDLPPLEPGEAKDTYESPPKTEYQRAMREGATRLHNHAAPNHPEWTVKRIAATRPGGSIYGTFRQRIRLRWDEPSPTIPAGGVRPQWFFAHPEQPRGLTVREVARLQSFPDTYVFHGTMIEQRILVGDAVPPLLAKAIAECLKKYLCEL
jgi:DNA (cytosine-5)-methyltransferase 1